MYAITSQTHYSDEDLDYYTGGRADKEQNDSTARPAISGSVQNIEQYNTVLLGYPDVEMSKSTRRQKDRQKRLNKSDLMHNEPEL